MSGQQDLSPQQRLVKATTLELIQRCGGFEAAASGARVSMQQLHNYTSPQKPNFMPADVIMPIEAMAGRPLLTTVMADAARHFLLPMDTRSEGELATAMARFVKECGEAVTAYAEGMLDGSLCDADLHRLDHELAEASSAAMAWRQEIKRRLERRA